MTAAIVLAQANIEGVPWWATLILLPILGVLLEALRRALKLTNPPKPTESATEPPSSRPPPVGASADEKMVYVEQLIGEITRSRDEARVELAEAEATILRLQQRLRESDAYIARLQAVLDRFAPPTR